MWNSLGGTVVEQTGWDMWNRQGGPGCGIVWVGQLWNRLGGT